MAEENPSRRNQKQRGRWWEDVVSEGITHFIEHLMLGIIRLMMLLLRGLGKVIRVWLE